MKIVVIPGSARHGSVNTALARLVTEVRTADDVHLVTLPNCWNSPSITSSKKRPRHDLRDRQDQPPPPDR